MVKLIVLAINNLKTVGGGHAVHERQAVLLTTVVIFHTFCIENENDLTPRRVCSNHIMLSCKSAILLISPLPQFDSFFNHCPCCHVRLCLHTGIRVSDSTMQTFIP